MPPSSEISVQRLARASDSRFLLYPYARYADDPLWAPPFLLAEKQRLTPGKNPFFENATLAPFLALRDGEVVGRVAAFVDRVHNELHGEKTAFFGLFEAADEQVAKALYRSAEGWATEQGMDRLRGPVSLTMEEGVGFQIDAHDSSPFMMMHYNGPEYPAWAEAAGYHKLKDFYAWLYRPNDEGKARMARVSDRLRRRLGDRLKIRQMSRWRWRKELDLLFDLYNQAWSDNWGFRPKNRDEYQFMSRDMGLIFIPAFSAVVELDGEPIAAVLSLPDVHQLTRPIGGRLLPFGWWQYLRRNKIFTRARMAIMGVRHEWRNRGFEAILIRSGMDTLENLGFAEGECSWVLEDNDAANKVIALSGCTLYKKYRLYEKPLSGAAPAKPEQREAGAGSSKAAPGKPRTRSGAGEVGSGKNTARKSRKRAPESGAGSSEK